MNITDLTSYIYLVNGCGQIFIYNMLGLDIVCKKSLWALAYIFIFGSMYQ